MFSASFSRRKLRLVSFYLYITIDLHLYFFIIFFLKIQAYPVSETTRISHARDKHETCLSLITKDRNIFQKKLFIQSMVLITFALIAKAQNV